MCVGNICIAFFVFLSNPKHPPPLTQQVIMAATLKPAMKHALRKFTADPVAAPFIQQCLSASLLGNYYHATPPNHTNIQERIAALQTPIRAVPVQVIQAAIAEYIAAKLPFAPIPNWDIFITNAVNTANAVIRGAKKTPLLIPPPPLDSTNDTAPPAQPAYSQCVAPTGHRSITICLTCKTVSAYLRNPPRGFHPHKVFAVSHPFWRPRPQHS